MTKQELIFNAGAKLFAERTYNSVGIRDIAREAGVNSAMISYYFGGKSGLLREIFSRFTSLVLTVTTEGLAEATDFYELCDITVRSFLGSARANRDVYLVGLRELNHDTADLQDIRDNLNERSWAIFSQNLERMGLDKPQDDKSRDIGFPAVMGLIFSDYLLGSGAFIDNDELIEIYIQVISEILKYGMPKFWE